MRRVNPSQSYNNNGNNTNNNNNPNRSIPRTIPRKSSIPPSSRTEAIERNFTGTIRHQPIIQQPFTNNHTHTHDTTSSPSHNSSHLPQSNVDSNELNNNNFTSQYPYKK